MGEARTVAEGEICIGVDLGTSGVRTLAVTDGGEIAASATRPLRQPRRDGDAVEEDPAIWWAAVVETLSDLARSLEAAPAAIAVDATSSTLLLADDSLRPCGKALLYNDARARKQAERIGERAPIETGAIGPSSSLAKLLWMHEQGLTHRATFALHQADWITAKLCGAFVATDYNNALKLGYDPIAQGWPRWLEAFDLSPRLFPKVVAPGAPLGTIDPAVAAHLGLSPTLRVVAPTTDSTAAFLATGANQPGEAVTSLGSTLVLKILAERPIFDQAHGVYSHRLGERWLVGGGSNAGGAALRQYFTSDEIAHLSASIDPNEPINLGYYPLISKGERFPICDPDLEPKMTPIPEARSHFLQAIFEGIASIEARGYALLTQLGAPMPTRVQTVGGGATNEKWLRIRELALGVRVEAAAHTEAAYGAALLAHGVIQSAFCGPPLEP